MLAEVDPNIQKFGGKALQLDYLKPNDKRHTVKLILNTPGVLHFLKRVVLIIYTNYFYFLILDLEGFCMIMFS